MQTIKHSISRTGGRSGSTTRSIGISQIHQRSPLSKTNDQTPSALAATGLGADNPSTGQLHRTKCFRPAHTGDTDQGRPLRSIADRCNAQVEPPGFAVLDQDPGNKPQHEPLIRLTAPRSSGYPAHVGVEWHNGLDG
jgi:hypothetical protein